jgi:bifunctional ADP-heptose synthase (sugar kinase/adenylyltransferase)
MRLDAEITEMLNKIDEDRLLASVEEFINKEHPQIIILEDYNKGVLTERIITNVIALCRRNNILTAVDPKRKNFFTLPSKNFLTMILCIIHVIGVIGPF